MIVKDFNSNLIDKFAQQAAMSEKKEINKVGCLASTVLQAVIALAYVMEGVLALGYYLD